MAHKTLEKYSRECGGDACLDVDELRKAKCQIEEVGQRLYHQAEILRTQQPGLCHCWAENGIYRGSLQE